MKILKSFDTKTDTEELESAISKYGEGNVILVKRHRILLIPPMFGILVANCVFGLLLYLIHTQYYKENSFLYWLIIVIYVYTTFSRCIHSVSGIILKVLEFEVLLMAISILVVDFIFLLILNRIMYRIIEYEMNFYIFTTNSFSSYSQKGFFKTQEMDIATSAIKIIQSSKEGLAGALLQYGNLYIHTDGDLNIGGSKTLELSYIPNPKKTCKKTKCNNRKIRIVFILFLGLLY